MAALAIVERLRSAAAEPWVRYLASARRRLAPQRAQPARPVGFGMGGIWSKLQYPFVQHQFLKTIDTLSLLPAVHSDRRYQEMLDGLLTRRDADGWWTAEAVNKPYAEFDFGQKKRPSAWLTLVALRVLVRSGHSSVSPGR